MNVQLRNNNSTSGFNVQRQSVNSLQQRYDTVSHSTANHFISIQPTGGNDRLAQVEGKLQRREVTITKLKEQRRAMREDLNSLSQSNAALLTQLNEQSSYFNVHMVELQRVIKHLEDHSGSVDMINHDLNLENESLKKKMAGERARFDRALRDKEEECAQMFRERLR